MAIRARRQQEKEEMRKTILAAATTIIITDGYEKLSMRKIADMIDYSPTTIYLYYKDKAQIVDDIALQMYEKVVSDIQEELIKHNDIPIDEQLALCFRQFIITITNHSEMGMAAIRSGTNIIFGKQNTPSPEGQTGISILQDQLQRGQQQSILRPLDDNVAWMLITALLGFSMNAIENQLYHHKNWAELIDSYTTLLLKGILAGGKSKDED